MHLLTTLEIGGNLTAGSDGWCGRVGEQTQVIDYNETAQMPFTSFVHAICAPSWRLVMKIRPRRHTRAQVRAIPCPRCGALVEENCRGVSRPWRISNHIERVRAASADQRHMILG